MEYSGTGIDYHNVVVPDRPVIQAGQVLSTTEGYHKVVVPHITYVTALDSGC